MTKILHIENLSIGYTSKKKETLVAKQINVSINKPKLIALIGINGIGKSTLLRTISKVQPYLKGKIAIFGKNIDDYKATEFSKKISLVLIEKIPSSNLTVYEVIALGRQVYTNWIGTLSSNDKDIIKEAASIVNINHVLHDKIDELSDGQYQKVMIARALAQDTDIILLDEPTAHLDIINKVEIFKLLKDLVVNKNKTIIISSHELQLAIQTANDLWLMNKNSFIQGSKEKLIANNEIQKIFTSNNITFNKKTNQFLFDY